MGTWLLRVCQTFAAGGSLVESIWPAAFVDVSLIEVFELAGSAMAAFAEGGEDDLDFSCGFLSKFEPLAESGGYESSTPGSLVEPGDPERRLDE